MKPAKIALFTLCTLLWSLSAEAGKFDKVINIAKGVKAVVPIARTSAKIVSTTTLTKAGSFATKATKPLSSALPKSTLSKPFKKVSSPPLAQPSNKLTIADGTAARLNINSAKRAGNLKAARDAGSTARKADEVAASHKTTIVKSHTDKRLLYNKITQNRKHQILKSAAKGKGNFGIGSASRSQSKELGKQWAGRDAKLASDKKTLVSKDKLRQYRPPAKKNSPSAKTGVQSNFESRTQPKGRWTSNAHLDIVD